MTNRTKFAQLRQAIIDARLACYLNDDEKQEMLEFIKELRVIPKFEVMEYGTNCNNLSYADGWNDCLKELGLL